LLEPGAQFDGTDAKYPAVHKIDRVRVCRGGAGCCDRPNARRSVISSFSSSRDVPSSFLFGAIRLSVQKLDRMAHKHKIPYTLSSLVVGTTITGQLRKATSGIQSGINGST
jgi:hypothetical protein